MSIYVVDVEMADDHRFDGEVERVIQAYGRRTRRYDILDPAVWGSVQEFERELIRMLTRLLRCSVKETTVLEIGCGSGRNLLGLLRLGFRPDNLLGSELLHERIETARQVLPAAIRLVEGDAMKLQLPDESFDVVFQSAVFTSLLDDAFQQALAAKMWGWVKPGGCVLWYDFTYDNPSNRDVRGVKLRRIRALFPEAEIYARRVTLAPPISRWVTRVHPRAYDIVNALPFLRTHLLCWLGKRD